LPAATVQELSPYLIPVDLPRNLTLYESGTAIESVYFLEDGICSIVAAMENGTTVEVGLVGRGGFVGMTAILGGGPTPYRSFMAIAGHGFRIKARVLVEQWEASAPLRACLLRSVRGVLVQTAQTAACNRVHDLHERLARWLLMCRDSVHGDQVPVTQELLATMLGTRRSSVTVAAGILHKAGLIDYTRGHVVILNHKRLAEAACECYRVVHAEYVRLGLLD
jgi:CRP-like cAMP-binding protein